MNDKILSNEIMKLEAKKLRPQAPIILIYGPPASGKSTLASEFPDTLFFTTETPFALENEKCGYRKHLDELWDFYDCTHNLIKDFKKERLKAREEKRRFIPPIKTIVFDNLTGLEGLIRDYLYLEDSRDYDNFTFGNRAKAIFGQVCHKSIKSHDPNKKLIPASSVLHTLEKIRNLFNITIILIAHVTLKEVGLDENKNPIMKLAPNIIKSFNDVIYTLVDEVIYLDKATPPSGSKSIKETIIMKSGNNKPNYMAKSKFGLPDVSPFKKDEGFKTLYQYWPDWYSLRNKNNEKTKND